MEVLDVLEKRRSIRKYQTKPVEIEKIKRVLEAARLGPSAGNMQPCHFIVINTPEARESLRSIYNKEWFVQAPTIVVACVDPREAWRKHMIGGEDYWMVDAAIAMQNLILVSTEMGLGTCWITSFDEKAAKKALNIPKHIRVVAMTPLGYPDEEKGPVTDRKPLDKMVHYNKW